MQLKFRNLIFLKKFNSTVGLLGSFTNYVSQVSDIFKSQIDDEQQREKPWREEPRWWRNTTGRPLSLLQIHRKNNWTQSKLQKQLLIASWGHQVPRKAAHCLQEELGQNIKDKKKKDKKRDKRARDRDPSWEGSLNRGDFQTPGNPRIGRSGGSFRISEGNLTGRKNK